MSTNTEDALHAKTFQNAPFDQPHHADIILCSSSGDNFHTLRALLSLSSVVFETMFTLPQDGARVADTNLPVVSLSEDSATLYQLLLWLDPRCKPSHKLGDIQSALCAADKYAMQGVMECMEQILLLCAEGIKAQPIRLYAIAIRYDFTKLARVAAKESLCTPLEERYDLAELDFIPASALQRLQTYYFECGKAAKQIATDFKMDWIGRSVFVWLNNNVGFHSPQCGALQLEGRWWQQWWVSYMRLVAEELYKKPRGTTVRGIPSFAAGTLEVAANCLLCRPKVYPDLVRFNEMLSKKVERRIANISLVIG